MLKVIEVNSEITIDLIEKYGVKNAEPIEMMAFDGKYNIDSINDYLNYFTHTRVEDEVFVGVIKNGSSLSEYHQNKLLKTFEESSDDQIHLLFIDRSDRLLETILSRAIVYRESVNFDFQDTELHKFAKPLVTTIETYDLLLAEDKIFRELYKIRKNLVAGNIDQAIINNSGIKYDRHTFLLFTNLVQNYLYETKRLDLLKFVFEVELKAKYQVNLGMQALSILIQIKNSKEYYERSSWN